MRERAYLVFDRPQPEWVFAVAWSTKNRPLLLRKVEPNINDCIVFTEKIKKEHSAKALEKDHLNDQNGFGHFQKNERIESLGQHISEHCIFAGDVFRIHGQ